MTDLLDTTLEDETRKAKRVLWWVVNGALAAYGMVVIVHGTAELFHQEGTRLMLMAVGLVGLRLWLRFDESEGAPPATSRGDGSRSSPDAGDR
ncbi:MAG: hypothetical protein KY397_00190 [Gemmatimonadetes bacterium]|nr:hypothetical protein [Gemmatimonadota bacterium]